MSWLAQTVNALMTMENMNDMKPCLMLLPITSATLATWCKELTLEKTLLLGKIEGRRRRRRQRTRWLDDITDSMNMSLSKLWEMAKGREAWRAAVHAVTKSQTWLSYWTTTNVHLKGMGCQLWVVHRNSWKRIGYRIRKSTIRGIWYLFRDS